MYLYYNSFKKNIMLFFLSRKGFWVKQTNIKNTTLLSLIRHYLLVSLTIFIVMINFKKKIDSLLGSLIIFNDYSYLNLIIGSLYTLLSIGVVYENYYFIQKNSIVTFSVFFKISPPKIRRINFLKNLIITLPILVFLCFYSAYFTVIYFFMIQYFSYHYLINKNKFNKKNWAVRQIQSRYEHTSIFWVLYYIISIISMTFFIKQILTPIFSIVILIVFYNYDQNIVQTTNLYTIFFSGLFLSTIFFGSKLPIFTFFSLNQDFEYISTLKFKTSGFFWKCAFYLSLVQLVITLSFFFFIAFFFLNLSLLTIFALSVSLIIGYFLMSLIQIIQSFYYREKKLTSPYELEVSRLPFKKRVVHYLYNIILIIILIRLDYADDSKQIYIFFSCIVTIIIIILICVKNINQKQE